MQRDAKAHDPHDPTLALPPAAALAVALPSVVGADRSRPAATGYAAFEVRSARDRALASGQAEAHHLARVLEAHVARGLDGFARTLGVLKRLHEGSGRAVPLAAFEPALEAASASEVERRILRFDREGRFVESSAVAARHEGMSVADRPWFARARDDREARMVVGRRWRDAFGPGGGAAGATP